MICCLAEPHPTAYTSKEKSGQRPAQRSQRSVVSHISACSASASLLSVDDGGASHFSSSCPRAQPLSLLLHPYPQYRGQHVCRRSLPLFFPPGKATRHWRVDVEGQGCKAGFLGGVLCEHSARQAIHATQGSPLARLFLQPVGFFNVLLLRGIFVRSASCEW